MDFLTFLSVCVIFLPAYVLIWRGGIWIDKIICGGFRPNNYFRGNNKVELADAPHPVDVFLYNKTVVSAVNKIINHFLGEPELPRVVPREYLVPGEGLSDGV